MKICENNLKNRPREISNKEIVDGFLKSRYVKESYIGLWPLRRCIITYLACDLKLSFDAKEAEGDLGEIHRLVMDAIWPVAESEAAHA